MKLPQQKEKKPTALRSSASSSSLIRLGIIGAGSFASNIMVPLLAKRKDVQIRIIASSTGIKAAAIAKKYNIPRCSSEAAEVIESEDIDCVFVFTRHGTHASFAERSLLAGKHVFVEKPLALTEESLQAVVDARATSGKVLMVGFNRRFSPLTQKLKNFFSCRCQPMIMEFRGNVGYRPPEHWLHHPTDGGGVILGEACHYIDFCRWLTDSPIKFVEATRIGREGTGAIPEDNVAISLNFEDGSLARIIYVSNGAPGAGRERCEAHAEGKTAVWEDFKYLKLVKGLGFPKISRNFLWIEKGYEEELEAFFERVKHPEQFPNDWMHNQIETSRAAIAAAKSSVA